jgi:hypothetical protein
VELLQRVVSYGSYVEQRTYLLFLKMADEQVQWLGKEPIIATSRDLRSSHNSIREAVGRIGSV